jgi:hypothetical protein
MSKGLSKEFCEHDDTWYNWDTGKEERCQELIPTDWPLEFHLAFITEVSTNPALDSLGIYTNGWEL